MLPRYFLIIRNYVLSVSLQRKNNFYPQNTLLDAFRMNSRNIIGSNPSMVVPLLANQDLTPMLGPLVKLSQKVFCDRLFIVRFSNEAKKHILATCGVSTRNFVLSSDKYVRGLEKIPNFNALGVKI